MLKSFSKIADDKEDSDDEKLKGGKADGEPDSKFNKKELKRGAKHESEHTKDKESKKEIAKDHLKEDPKYYKKLDKMEKKSSVVDQFSKTAGPMINAAVGTNRAVLKAPVQTSAASAINSFNAQRKQIGNYAGSPASRKIGPISTPAATPTASLAPGASK